MRSTRATARGIEDRTVFRVVQATDLPREWSPDIRLLVQVDYVDEADRIGKLKEAGVVNVALACEKRAVYDRLNFPAVLVDKGGLESGDVVAVVPWATKAQILFRETDVHHTVFLTNRCNSFCVMCSQPPTAMNDDWLVDEACQVAAHIRHSPRVVGFTGGEPSLLGPRLRMVLESFISHHPTTTFEILTNGRLFWQQAFAKELLEGLPQKVAWMVPLYGHAHFLHDFVVQTPGAFDETIRGILHLHSYGQAIQIRIVLAKPVLEYLPELCTFIGKNLPFVREVAIMACEPIGFALANREICHVDLGEWQNALKTSVSWLTRLNVKPVLMNAPLCALPRELWEFAHKSISDWKQVYPDECASCAVRSRCCGLFASHARGWRPARIQAIAVA